MSAVGRNRWKILSQDLDRALDLDEGARQAWLVSIAAADPSIADDVRTLLHEHETLMKHGFLEEPMEPAAAMLGRFTGPAAVKLLNLALVGRAGEERFRRFVEGDAIDRCCDTRALGIEARIRLFLDVLAAVSHAHANLMVHRGDGG